MSDQTDPAPPADAPTTEVPLVPLVHHGWVEAPAVSSSPALTPVPDAAPAGDVAPLSGLADVLHVLACGCPAGGDIEGHGVDFEDVAGKVRASVLADALPPRAPVEAKVKAGAWGTLIGSVVLALLTLLLDQLDVIRVGLGDVYPWVGPVVAVLGVVLPTIIGTLQAYAAPHTPRPGVPGS